MKASAACVDASTFQRLLAGKLSAAEVEAFLGHLEGCEPCVRAARALPEDSFAEAMRASQRLPPLDVDAAPLNTLIARVLQLRSHTSTMNQAAPGHATLHNLEVTGAVPVAPAIGRYRIVRELGRGGMGSVYEADDPQLRRRVAVKVPQFGGSAETQAMMRQRFLREARAAAAVDHPNVCKIYDVGEQDGKPFVVMAFVEGTSLAERLPHGRRVKERSAVSLIVRIGEALLAVHAHGIIHRDLKPANILLTKEGAPILTDFGLAHVHTESQHLTGEGAMLGTPAYMAPEQVMTELGPVTTRADLYSLAVVLFQMLTGRLPVEGSAVQIIGHHVAGKSAPPASQFHAGIDPVLDAILRKAMAHRPEDRYPDVRAFVQALKEWLRGAVVPVAVAWAPPEVFSTASLTVPPPLPVAQLQPADPELLPIARVAALDQPPLLSLPDDPRRSRGWWLIAAGLLLLGGGVAVGIIIVRDKQGKEVARVKVPGEFLVDEDFRKTFESGAALPAGWTGAPGVSVNTDKDGRACLKLEPGSSVTLPPVVLSGNFVVEVEFQFSSNQRAIIEISLGGKKVPPVRVCIPTEGAITIGPGGNDLPNPSKSLLRKRAVNRMRLVRKGSLLFVFLNDELACRARPDNTVVEYDTATYSIAGGKSELYKVRIGPLPK